MTTITMNKAIKTVTRCIEENVPVFLHGAPGIGKSDVVRGIAKSMGIGLIDFRASIRDAVDLRGLPLVDENSQTTKWLSPNELPQIERDGPRGILFMDELNHAPDSVMKACFGLVLERHVGEYKLPDGWVPVAAGNRMLDRAGVGRIPTPLRNRFEHFTLEVDLNAWCDWATKAGLAPQVIAFIRFRPNLLHKMPDGDDMAFPTPRSWAQAAKFVNDDIDIRQSLIAGQIGDAPAAELEGFLQIWKELPSIDAILRDPEKTKVPGTDQPAVQYAVATALARRVTKDTFANALIYAMRLPREFEIICATDAVKRDPKLKTAKGFTEWAARNAEVVL